jgi:hypothetical protein
MRLQFARQPSLREAEGEAAIQPLLWIASLCSQ